MFAIPNCFAKICRVSFWWIRIHPLDVRAASIDKRTQLKTGGFIVATINSINSVRFLYCFGEIAFLRFGIYIFQLRGPHNFATFCSILIKLLYSYKKSAVWFCHDFVLSEFLMSSFSISEWNSNGTLKYFFLFYFCYVISHQHMMRSQLKCSKNILDFNDVWHSYGFSFLFIS